MASSLWQLASQALGLAADTSVHRFAAWVREGRVRLAGLALAPLFRQVRETAATAAAADRAETAGTDMPTTTATPPLATFASSPDAGEELVAAAVLLHLKVLSLLPLAKPPATAAAAQDDADRQEVEVAGDWKSELPAEAEEEVPGFDPAGWSARLHQAEQLQRLAAALAERYAEESLRLPRGQPETPPEQRLYLQPLGRLRPTDLARAWAKLQARWHPPADPPIFRAESSWRYLVPRLIQTLRRQGELLLQTWTHALAKPERVAAFLAFLELVRRGRAEGVQPSPTEPIRVRWLGESAAVASQPPAPENSPSEPREGA